MKAILLTLIIILQASCSTYDQNISIDNITQSQEIILKNHNDKNVYALTINVTGNIDGTAEIYLMLNGKPYKPEIISGNVNVKWGGDWYSNDALIVYKANDVNKGKLSIGYTFSTL